MATLTRQDITEAGLEASYASAASGGDQVANDGRTVLHVKNAGGAARTVTVTAQDSSESVPGFGTMTRADIAVAVPDAGDRFIGPLPLEAFNDAAGNIQISYSAVTGVTIAALRLPPVA